MKKVGIIGCGNMGSAMLYGMLATGVFHKEEVMVYHRRKEAATALQNKFGIVLADNYKELMEWAEVVILGVKPNGFESLIHDIAGYVKENQIIISIAAGNSIQKIEAWFQKDIKLVRLMPNTPAMVGEAMTAIMTNSNITSDDLLIVKQICNSFGKCEVIDEGLIDAVTGVSGSSPAYVYMFIEALADGAVREGMKREQAYDFASQAVLGAAKMVLQTGIHPGVLKDAVCSPNGTTIAAVTSLEATGFRSSVIKAVQACAQRSRDMKE